MSVAGRERRHSKAAATRIPTMTVDEQREYRTTTTIILLSVVLLLLYYYRQTVLVRIILILILSILGHCWLLTAVYGHMRKPYHASCVSSTTKSPWPLHSMIDKTKPTRAFVLSFSPYNAHLWYNADRVIIRCCTNYVS